MEKKNKKMVGIRALMKEMKTEMYAIENPELVALDDYIKNLYLKVLCTVIQYENEPSEMQVMFLNRIIKGIGVEDPLEEYMRKALEISNTDICEFLSFMKENSVRYYFTLEGMLLVAMGNKRQNLEYFAEVIELCGITKADLNYLSLVAKSVLQQESSYYEEAKNTISEGTRKLNFYSYIQNYYVGAAVDTDLEQYYTSPSLEIKSEITFPTQYKSRVVTLKNFDICLEDNWYFKGCKKVEFINCRFTTSNSVALNFEAVGYVSIKECEFKNFDNGVAVFASVNKIEIRDCYLCDCEKTYKDSDSRGVFEMSYPNDNPVFIFENNKVQNCYMKGTNIFGCTSGILFVGNARTSYSINNNEFIGCQCYKGKLGIGDSIIARLSGNEANVSCSDNQLTGGVTRLFEYEEGE